VRNPENVPSEPVLTITCTADAVLQVGAAVINIKNPQGTITLDCALKLAYRGNALMNSYIDMEGPWPRLNPGYNDIRWTGGISRIVISPNWRSR
jgi:phage-related protein